MLGEVRKWDAAHPKPQPGERDAAIKPLCDAAKATCRSPSTRPTTN